MTKAYEQRKASNERYLSTLDVIYFRVSKESGMKEIIKQHAERTGESVQAFMLRAVKNQIELDKKTGTV